MMKLFYLLSVGINILPDKILARRAPYPAWCKNIQKQ
jgi:hypothetical protein